jgi:uncharacterized protein (TIGR03435 family)
MRSVNQSIGSLAWFLEGQLGKPVLDNTGLTNHYDFELKWDGKSNNSSAAEVIVQAVRDQLGLELTVATRPVEVLIVERAEEGEE